MPGVSMGEPGRPQDYTLPANIGTGMPGSAYEASEVMPGYTPMPASIGQAVGGAGY
jgi:hypothetical protein